MTTPGLYRIDNERGILAPGDTNDIPIYIVAGMVLFHGLTNFK